MFVGILDFLVNLSLPVQANPVWGWWSPLCASLFTPPPPEKNQVCHQKIFFNVNAFTDK